MQLNVTNRSRAYPEKASRENDLCSKVLERSMFGFEGTEIVEMILDSSMVEHTAVNRGVVGSSPTRGAHFRAGYVMYPAFLNYIMF